MASWFLMISRRTALQLTRRLLAWCYVVTRRISTRWALIGSVSACSNYMGGRRFREGLPLHQGRILPGADFRVLTIEDGDFVFAIAESINDMDLPDVGFVLILIALEDIGFGHGRAPCWRSRASKNNASASIRFCAGLPVCWPGHRCTADPTG